MPARKPTIAGYGPLRNHPRSKGVLSFGRWKPIESEPHFQTNGVTKPIHDCFTPNFRRPRSRPRASSRGLGPRVHKQIEDTIKGTPVKRMHRYARAFFSVLAERGLRAVDAEPAIISLRGNFMTYPDVLCVDSKGQLVVVSVKTGFNGAYNVASPAGARCAAPFEAAAKTERSQHQIQLAAEVWALRNEYKFHVAAAYIIYLGINEQRAGGASFSVFGTTIVKTDTLDRGFQDPARLVRMFAKMKEWSLQQGKPDLERRLWVIKCQK